jgi:hypothetical protein
MESEKVKEIKLALEIAIKTGERMKQDTYLGPVKVSEILEYINELENENERLNKALVDNLKAYEYGYNDAADFVNKILNEFE